LEHIPGKHMAESDVGFILLGHALEIIGGMPLDRQALSVIFQPLRMKSTGYIRLSSLRKDRLEPVGEIIAPTGHCSWRERDICGEVWDENAWTMGGVAGHSGIFSTADDLMRFCSELIDCWHGRGTLVSRDVIRTFWLRQSDDSKKTWALGWNTNSGEAPSCGNHFSRFSVGHDSSTGCSLWIDPHRELSVVLLSNPLHTRSDSSSINKIRPELHDLVMQALCLG
jgi:CubicO group peptidase (beta-lactamase class C family)